MTLRVYVEHDDGEKRFIDYGLEASTIKSVFKVEVLQDESKVKTWMGSKWTGIKSVDDELKARDKQEEIQKAKKLLEEKQPKSKYEIYDYKKHDTDHIWYWVSALCTNCNNSRQIVIKKGEPIIPNQFKLLNCDRCGVKGSLRYARWDGHKYVIAVKEKKK